MNKTVNINLGGFAFQVDETAYEKLKAYLAAVAQSLSDETKVKDEIIADIEARISELLSERMTDARHVVSEADINEVVAIMGQPEDYAAGEESHAKREQEQADKKSAKRPKKLFRDGEDKFLGGVASGIGRYLGIDTVWVRLVFIVLAASSGIVFGVVAYIILWIVVPEARTTAEKLQMEGEAVNIDNIEKRIRKEYQHLSGKIKDGVNDLGEKISHADYQAYGKQAKAGFRRAGDALGKQTKTGFRRVVDAVERVLAVLLQVAAKLIGLLLVLIASAVIIGLFFGLMSVFALDLFNIQSSWIQYPPFFHVLSIPVWLFVTFAFALVGIPFLMLFFLGLKILSSHTQFKKAVWLTLLGLWLLALLGVISGGASWFRRHAHNGVNIENKTLYALDQDTLYLQLSNNRSSHDEQVKVTKKWSIQGFSVSKHVYTTVKRYSRNIDMGIEQADSEQVSLKIKKVSQGSDHDEANENASEIAYHYAAKDDTLALDAYFLSSEEYLAEEQEVYVTVYLPENKIIAFDDAFDGYLNTIKMANDAHEGDFGGHYFQMTDQGLACTDCASE